MDPNRARIEPTAMDRATSTWRRRTSRRRGLTLVEAIVFLVIIALSSSALLPIVHRAGAGSMTAASMSNLKTLSAAHAAYAADWNGRQMTLVVDDLSYYGGLGSYSPPGGGEHPPILLGWDCPASTSIGDSGLWAYWFHDPYTLGNSTLLWPINPITRFGWFRMPNAKAMHDYVNGKFYEATYYAPGDTAVIEAVGQFLDNPCEYLSSDVTGGHLPLWSSYCMSPAALFHPLVMARDHPVRADQMAKGFAAPSFDQVRYPDLKTHMIEHNWVENPPALCNPAFSGGAYYGCEPYHFNHGAAASPVTLFYDGHVRVFPNTEALAADASISKELGSVDGLWFSPGGALWASTLATDGYYTGASFDGVEIGHTILTVDGIFGRDTLAGVR